METNLTHNAGNEIVLYQADNSQNIEVRIENDTVWLNRQQLSQLFGRDVKTIGKHINNALKEELRNIPTVANFATVQKEGQRVVTRNVDYYSLDMILSIGYRVNSINATRFRIWANHVLKEYILRGAAVNQRFDNIESRLLRNEHHLLTVEQKMDEFLHSALPPKQGASQCGTPTL